MRKAAIIAAMAAFASGASAQQAKLVGTPEAGEWRYVSSLSTSEAIFAEGALVLRCDRVRKRLSVLPMAGSLGTVSIVTDSGTMSVGGGIDLPPQLSAFDALAFARGKFGIEMTGRPGLTVYPWDSTAARSIEDCRI